MADPLSRATPRPYSTPLTCKQNHSSVLGSESTDQQTYSMQLLTTVCHVMAQTASSTTKEVVYGHIDLEGSCSDTSASQFFGLDHRQ